jgi:hypothetical protein
MCFAPKVKKKVKDSVPAAAARSAGFGRQMDASARGAPKNVIG